MREGNPGSLWYDYSPYHKTKGWVDVERERLMSDIVICWAKISSIHVYDGSDIEKKLNAIYSLCSDRPVCYFFCQARWRSYHRGWAAVEWIVENEPVKIQPWIKFKPVPPRHYCKAPLRPHGSESRQPSFEDRLCLCFLYEGQNMPIVWR